METPVENLPPPALHYRTYELPKSTVRTLLIPSQGSWTVEPALSSGVSSLEVFAQKHRAIAVINGGFFDPLNQQSTSYLIQNGQTVADPQENKRMMDNPDLALYLPQILNRSEWRRYRCGKTLRYAIAPHQTPPPQNCQLLDALGGGPQLLPELTAVREGFVAEVEGVRIRDPLGRDRANARSAVGITRDGSLLLAMAAQKPNPSNNGGLSLPEFAAFLKGLGVENALNLDGGTSSAFYYRGTTFYGKLDEAGNPISRPVKSVLLVRENP
ncbi:phosphodiester glycosidase family protein [Lusitaniella coriacea]|uniref:phosphodiester glycosidase family protein n=1 Tax=Lusitaniella coriacea TaxID=1983105 RepID=UPI002D21CF89|nr:phosphodiester glycosidase family protein [Lusitaniella coriacea]